MMLGTALALALVQDLTPKTAVGQTAIVTIDSIVEVEVKASEREGDKPEETSRTVLREQFTQSVLEAKDGRATRMKLSCDRSTIEKSGTKMPMTGQLPTERENKTFEVRAGEAPRREDGGPLPEGSGHIGRWEDFAELVAGASGGTWKVDAKKLSMLSVSGNPGALDGQLSCANEGVSSGVATVSFTGSRLAGKVGEGETFTADVKGKLLFDVNAGRPVQLSIEGSFEYTKKVTHDQPGVKGATPPARIDVGTVTVRSKEWSVDVKFKNP